MQILMVGLTLKMPMIQITHDGLTPMAMVMVITQLEPIPMLVQMKQEIQLLEDI